MTHWCEDMPTWIERFSFTSPPCIEGRGHKRHRYVDFGPAVTTGYGGEEVCKFCGTIRCLDTSEGKGEWTIAGYVAPLLTDEREGTPARAFEKGSALPGESREAPLPLRPTDPPSPP